MSACEEVNLTFLLKQLEGSPPAPVFKVDRLSPKCRTPRRNAEVEEAISFSTSYLRWTQAIGRYLERLRGIHPQRCTTPPSSAELLVPALPLFIKGAPSPKPLTPTDSLVLLGEEEAPGELVVTAADGNRLLGEESRALGEQRANLMEIFPEDGSIYTWVESFRTLVLQHCEHVLMHWLEMVDYIERMLRAQLVAAIGKEVKPAEFVSALICLGRLCSRAAAVIGEWQIMARSVRMAFSRMLRLPTCAFITGSCSKMLTSQRLAGCLRMLRVCSTVDSRFESFVHPSDSCDYRVLCRVSLKSCHPALRQARA